jgi:hypothetical protein
LVGVTKTFFALAAVGFMKLRPAPLPVPVDVRLLFGAAERISGAAGAVRFAAKRAEARLELEPFRGLATAAATAVRREPACDMLLMLFVIELRDALELDLLRFSLELVVIVACAVLPFVPVDDMLVPLTVPFPLRNTDPELTGVFIRLVVELEALRLDEPPDLVKLEEDVPPLPTIVGLDRRTASLLLAKADLLRERVEELMLGWLPPLMLLIGLRSGSEPLENAV